MIMIIMMIIIAIAIVVAVVVLVVIIVAIVHIVIPPASRTHSAKHRRPQDVRGRPACANVTRAHARVYSYRRP